MTLIGSVTSKDSLRPKATVGSPNRDCVWYGKSGSKLLVSVLTDASLHEYREHSKIPATLQTWFASSHANTHLDLGMSAVKMAKGLVAPTSRSVVLLYGHMLIDAELSTTTTDAATKLPALTAFAELIATRADGRWASFIAP